MLVCYPLRMTERCGAGADGTTRRGAVNGVSSHPCSCEQAPRGPTRRGARRGAARRTSGEVGRWRAGGAYDGASSAEGVNGVSSRLQL